MPAHHLPLRPALFAALLTFSISFTVYLFTLSPTIGLEDSGELAAAVVSWGIAHPSGYPLYVNLAKLFTLIIPLGDLAWRVNLFSAFCGSLTIALLTFFLTNILSSLFPRQWEQARGSSDEKRLGSFAGTVPPTASRESEAESRAAVSSQGKLTASFRAATPSVYLIAVATSLAFAFSPIFWSQSIIAEVYTLNTLFFMLTLVFIWRYTVTRSALSLYAFAFAYGLSLTNHTMMALLAPVFLLYLISLDYKSYKKYAARYALAFVLALLGLSLYFFIIMRAQSDPVINWGHPETWTRFWAHVSRRTYQDVQLDFWNNITQLKKLIYVHFFFRDLLQQINIVGALFSLIGFVVLWFKNRRWFAVSFGIFLSNSLLVILLRHLSYTYETETIYTVYYLPPFLIAFLWLGVGAQAVFGALMRLSGQRIFPLLLSTLIIALPLASVTAGWRDNDRSTRFLTHDWAVSLLESLPPAAVLLVHNEQPASDSQIFNLSYVHLIERMRPDVAIVDFAYLTSRWYHPVGNDIEEIGKLPLRLQRARLLNRVWAVTQELDRPVFTLWPVGTDLNGDLMSVPNGLAHRVYANAETARLALIPPAEVSIRNTDDAFASTHPYLLDFVSELSYSRAAYLLSQGHFKASEIELINAFNLDQTPLGINAQDYMQWRQRWMIESQKQASFTGASHNRPASTRGSPRAAAWQEVISQN